MVGLRRLQLFLLIEVHLHQYARPPLLQLQFQLQFLPQLLSQKKIKFQMSILMLMKSLKMFRILKKDL